MGWSFIFDSQQRYCANVVKRIDDTKSGNNFNFKIKEVYIIPQGGKGRTRRMQAENDLSVSRANKCKHS